MITIDDLSGGGHHASALSFAEADPLRAADALLESQLLDCRVCPLTAVAAILIDLRTALQLDVGNAALLVVHGVRSFSWTSPRTTSAPLRALSVVSSVPSSGDASFQLGIGTSPESNLVVQGNSADFYVLDVEGIGDVPPDYSDVGLVEIAHALPSWSSVCSVLQSSSSR